jgi:hypothetical protein
LTNKNYYKSLDFISLSSLLELKDEATIKNLLSTFSCTINNDLEKFLHENSIDLEKRKISRTYLYFNQDLEITAYFTLSLKILNTNGISKTLIQKLDGVRKDRENIPCYLIGQLGKNSNCTYKIGQYLLDRAIQEIEKVNIILGGRFIILDSVNKKEVIDFYTNKQNNFKPIKEYNNEDNNVTMFYPLF